MPGPLRLGRGRLVALVSIFAFFSAFPVLYAALVSAPAQAAPADDGRNLFETRCASCHTVGGGRTVGPDLKGILDKRDRGWLIRFISTPDRLIAENDPLAAQMVKEYGMPMPNMGLTPAQAEQVLAYLDGSGNAPSEKAPAEETAPPGEGDAAWGRDLFTGRAQFSNSGAACASCHNASGIGALGGGTMARDLSDSYSRLGEPALTSIIKGTPFPIMKAIYGQQQLTDDEVAHLVAFLKESSQQRAGGNSSAPFIVISAVGFMAILGIMQFAWRRRLTGVRQSLVKGGSR
ncbi:MAG: c-type cytochrome [Chloroflexi bacterium]|nr:c-type cytochrome [Chloroflexota bacterium]